MSTILSCREIQKILIDNGCPKVHCNQETLRKYFKGSKPRPLTKKMRVAVQKATSSKSKISSLRLGSSLIVMAERESLLTEVRNKLLQ